MIRCNRCKTRPCLCTRSKTCLTAKQTATNERIVVPVPGDSGSTPVVGPNGNWWIDGVDTGQKAIGEDGGTYQADEEDITAEQGNGVIIKFKDRKYNPQQHSGLGYKILRKNIVAGRNILSESMFSENTIHEIRYDYDLDGATLQLPENATLRFNGGSIGNGTIDGNNARIEDTVDKIFRDDVNFTGKFITVATRPEWFGAVAYQQNISASAWWWDRTAEPASGYDSAKAFNKAIELAVLSGGKCVADNGIYRITETVNIPNYVKLHMPSGSGVFATMEGEGNVVVEGSKDDTDYRYIDTNGQRPTTLKSNQYFDSDCMAVAFRMTARGTAITGGGTISIALSRYTIGILMEGNQFASVNMVFAPELDIKVIGGSTNRSIPDPDDLVITHNPESEEAKAIGEVGDFAYFPNTPNKETRKKTNATTWQWWCNESEFNTCLRTEVLSDDSRIINLHANVWLDWGFRGIENVARSGGWFNQAVWLGTVSDMHSNFISFFGNSIQGLSTHDMSLQTYQIHPKMSSQCRIMALYGYVGGVKSGNTWDLTWAPPERVSTAYYLGSGTRDNEILIDGQRFLVDEAFARGTNYIIDKVVDKNYRPFDWEENMLKYTGGRGNVGNNTLFRKFVRIQGGLDVYDRFKFQDVYSRVQDSSETIPSYIFDEETDKFFTVVNNLDVANKFNGTAFMALSTFSGNTGANNTLVLDLIVRGASNVMPDIYATLYTTNGAQIMTRKVVPEKSRLDISLKTICSLEFSEEIIGRSFRSCMFTIYSPDSTDPCQVDLVGMRLMGPPAVNGTQNYKYGLTANRPFAAPKGHIYYNTSLDVPEMNIGDSETQDWREVPIEEVGVWAIPNGGGITAFTANYSKIGKQVGISGRISFGTGYVAGTDVQIVLPFAPQFGGVYTIGDLTFTLGSNTNAQVKSSAVGNNKPFNLNYKTI